MPKRRKKSQIVIRVVKVEVPKDPRGLYRVYYQHFRGNLPIEPPYPADMTKTSYELLEMVWILTSEFRVPEPFIYKFIDKAREVEQEADSFRD